MTALKDMVTSAERRRRYESTGEWNADTLPKMVNAYVEESPGSTAVIDQLGSRIKSYADLKHDAGRIAGLLRSLGVGAGDVVSVQMPNWYETIAIDLAVLSVGAVVNPLLPIYRARELTHIMSVGKVRVMFSPESYRGFDYVSQGEELKRSVPSLEHHFPIPDPADDPDRFDRWIDGLAPAALESERDPSAVSELIFTSGTEAQPKAIMHTEQTANFCMRSAWDSLAMNPDDVVWMPSPIGHSTGFNYGVRMALYHGLPIVLQDRWNPVDAMDLIEEFKCSYTLAATTFVTDLITHEEVSGRDLSSMRLFSSGGAPVPPDVVESASALNMNLLRIYGSTEALCVSWVRPGSPREKALNTDGPALEGVEIEVREDGESLIGQAGEIHVRGPNTSVGLYDDPERTAATYDEDGWVHSGDLGILDEDGYLTIVGRKKEIIIRGGLNIAPREIEEVVALHPDVFDVAVVGLPSPRMGEITCACVVLKPQAELDLDALVSFLKEQQLANYKLPERLEVLEELPRTLSGKVQKHVIVTRLSEVN